ncbi:hypothetical protein [Brucella lupini]|uniref:Uncharacterized protein n=1 Tax=Brucella lupini TaxID=255457 RepID=A0A256GHB9_9HYPH|nr:hypothetical protein [Brucella lupini]KAB2701311.1 hypothetical protein F9L03_24000 [Brucella lupini]OYR26286.1 hypothetical protein CES86_3754 [Brucella lupini]
MALTFPLSLAAFADKLQIETVKWRLAFQQETTGLGSGEVITADLAPPRWEGDVTLGPMYHDDAAAIQALIESLGGALSSFYLYAPQKAYPVKDPTGSIMGSSAPVIASVGANNKSLSVSGLPAAYQLSVGDLFAFSYGENPVRRNMHRLVEGVTATGGGTTSVFEVAPPFRPGVTAGLALTFIKPAIKVKILPGSFDEGTAQGLITQGMAFSVYQIP